MTNKRQASNKVGNEMNYIANNKHAIRIKNNNQQTR